MNEFEKYRADREHLMYYRYIDMLLFALTQSASSIIDVGSNGMPVLEPLTWIKKRHSLDMENPYQSGKVLGIKENFYTFQASERYSFATCFQVLEHLDEPKLFCEKLFDIADDVLISVPYEWPKGHYKWHLNDPVTHESLKEWTGRDPAYFIIVEELFVGVKRCIYYYPHNSGLFSLAEANATMLSALNASRQKRKLFFHRGYQKNKITTL